MAFKDIAGNSRVKKILKLSLEKKRVPNSILFCGPEGVGQSALALVLAKALNCLQKQNDACETCANCKAINNKSFPDVIMISPEVESVKIEQIRFLKQMAYLKPMSAKKRIFIVEEAEKMTEEASNSLLKVLEEPPLFSHIFLVSSNPLLILPTIKSRCQILNFSPVSKEEIERVLMERGVEEEKARLTALLVRGNMDQALSLEWEEVQHRRQEAWGLFSTLIRKEEFSSFLSRYSFGRRKSLKEDLGQVLELFSSFCRDFLLIKEKSDVRFLMNPDYEKKIREKENDVSRDQILKIMRRIDGALSALDNNANPGLLVSSLYSQVIG